MNTAIDISQYSGEVTQAQMQAVRQAGCSRVVVALNNLPLAQRQLKAANDIVLLGIADGQMGIATGIDRLQFMQGQAHDGKQAGF